MLVRLRGKCFSHHIAEELSLLTGRAFLPVASVRHDDAMSCVTFTIERFALIGVKRRCLGLFDVPVYDMQTGPLKTHVAVKSVQAVSLKTNLKTGVDRVQILQGILLRQGRIAIVSVEEDRGEPFFSLEISIGDIDMTLDDEAT